MEQLQSKILSKKDEMAERIREEIKETEEKVKDKLKEMQDMGSEVLRNFLNVEAAPNKVVEVKTDSFTDRRIHLREHGLLLYLPAAEDVAKKDKNQQNYEIVLHRPFTETLSNTFSLYRTSNLEDAEIKFITLKEKLPDLIEICKEMYNTQGLQKICDVLAEHPSWTLAHLAAHFSLHDAFSNPKVSSFLNSTDSDTGMSPLQVAITTQNLKTVQIMVAANCSLEHLDHNANTVFHFAASTTKDIIATLSQNAPPRCISLRNKNGYTPLHMACLADKPECVKALLMAGADVNKTAATAEGENIEPAYVSSNFIQDHRYTLYNNDMKYGGTPLHWASSRLVIEALVDMNCHIDAVNFESRTALHVMVERNRLECVVALLSHNANPNLADKDGNTPLHLAVKLGSIPIIQCLIIFGIDLDVVNNAGETARHLIKTEQEPKILYYLHAVGAKNCAAGVTNCTEGCRYGGTYGGIPPPRPIGATNRDALDMMLATAAMEVATAKHKNGKFPNRGRLLCLDGGGIRGLVLVEILLELEYHLQMPICHCFDWLAGTSTGGILALAIAMGKSMKECLCLYFRLKEMTFVGKRPYSSETLETIMKETFGTESVMTDIKDVKVMVTGVLADRKPVELHLFRNYKSASNILGVVHDSPYELPDPPEEQEIWKVGRATGAAPTYFRAFGRFLDGGLIANNPTLDALTEIQEHCLALRAVGREEEASPVSVVVSLGTGAIPVTEEKNLDVFRPESLWDSARLYMGISALGKLLIDQATQADGRVVDRARAWCSSIGVPFFRFNPQMSEDITMDERSDEKLCNMLWETKAYMHEKMSHIRELADILRK